ncbi:MAG: hypothetical protein ACOZQL_01835 [Myxococcota bacterium]
MSFAIASCGDIPRRSATTSVRGTITSLATSVGSASARVAISPALRSSVPAEVA